VVLFAAGAAAAFRASFFAAFPDLAQRACCAAAILPRASALKVRTSLVVLGKLAPAGRPGFRFHRRLYRFRLLSVLFCVVTLAGAIALSGGSGGSSGSSTLQPTAHNTPAGSYTINVIANSGSTSHTIAITLVVQ
jgi:hypothetical protein